MTDGRVRDNALHFIVIVAGIHIPIKARELLPDTSMRMRWPAIKVVAAGHRLQHNFVYFALSSSGPAACRSRRRDHAVGEWFRPGYTSAMIPGGHVRNHIRDESRRLRAVEIMVPPVIL